MRIKAEFGSTKPANAVASISPRWKSQDRIATMNPPEASIHELWVKDVGLARTRDVACRVCGGRSLQALTRFHDDFGRPVSASGNSVPGADHKPMQLSSFDQAEAPARVNSALYVSSLAGPLSACRGPLAIRRGIAASRLPE